MLKQWLRIFASSGSTVTDLSLAMSSQKITPIDVSTPATEYLYLAQYFAFNNFYVELSNPNNLVANIIPQIWDGSEWVDCVDVLDGTSDSGKTLKQSGVIQYTPDRDHGWQIITDTSEDAPTPLDSLKVYDLYWLRLKFSAALSPGLKIKNLGYLFCLDSHLSGVDPEVMEFLDAWEEGKTDWKEQIILASQELVEDLKSRKLVKDRSSILRFDDVQLACVYKTLNIIYSPLGENYESKAKNFQNKYNSLMNGKRFTFDMNGDATVQRGEIKNTTTMGIR